MTTNKRIVLSSDHSGIQLRQVVAAHIAEKGWRSSTLGRQRLKARLIQSMVKRLRNLLLLVIAGSGLCCAVPAKGS
ncbi:hypothetical protein PsAD14_05638 [Pseudovibrio sp. Ad14]|nr:hypothetical protein PsW74_02482 [Pseudovibrio sp. W74]KZL03922.1 hypothetical protein PsAD14_05638 [Pseudovibrio sp. Ad14]